MRIGLRAHEAAVRGRRARPGFGHQLARLVRSGGPRCSDGNVAVEFALAMPVLILLMLCSAELGRFVLLYEKMDQVATTVSDLISQSETVSESEITDTFAAADQVAEPFDFSDLGVVIVSSVTNPDGTGPVIAWQRSGGGAYGAASKLGAQGDTPVLPADFVVRQGETAIIAEVYYNFTPFLSSLIVKPQVIYRSADHRPRIGTLDTVEAG
jgi:Flp pilus assembly protein TadG